MMRSLALTLMLLAPAQALAEFITVQSTTSTQNSGLFDAILPEFTGTTGIDVRVVAVGTGQALRNARAGDGDVLLVHAKQAEEAFVAEGFGVSRADVMYNDFVLVGPVADPAGLQGGNDILYALRVLAETKTPFASRGDDSGTHKAELRLWAKTDAAPDAAKDEWYRETGSGMGATLNVAVGLGAYTLTDRATWIAFGNKQSHAILVQGDQLLFNQYGVILVSPERHPTVKAEAGQMFIDWLLGKEGQTAIAAYSVEGQQLFFPNAAPEQ